MTINNRTALAGIKVIELGSGEAGAYCGRLLRDAGAVVTVVSANAASGHSREATHQVDPYASYLSAGKTSVAVPTDRTELSELCAAADIVIIGEDENFDRTGIHPSKAVVELSWFGKVGPYAEWGGNDLIIQALTGMPHLAGPVEGPPLHASNKQATVVGGVTAYIAAIAGLLAPGQASARRFEVNILEANMVLSEMDIHFVERDGLPLQRHGINRFSPNGPVGIYPCKDGWVGITATTPDQWLSLCTLLGLDDLKADNSLATRELRFERLDEVEAAMAAALKERMPEEWGDLGRAHRVPIVPVPNAPGILAHPIFRERMSLASVDVAGQPYRVPRTPFGLMQTPTSQDLDNQSTAVPTQAISRDADHSPTSGPPLKGMTIVDFSMGWAGPLASRLLCDLGATVLKIEAGRYPDWWRGVNWTAEYIAEKKYEDAKGFCALNRGKLGVSLDLTSPTGKHLALSLIAKADAVVENQAAGVMEKLGLSYDAMKSVNPEIVLLSMSAFGTGNPWSDTRAYGSTLEQGSGLPSFIGTSDTPPTMGHLAYGDPVGGLFGCAAVLTALAHKARSGKGQYVNLSMVEAMLQLTTPALLEYQATGKEPLRLGNRHAAMSPHDIYPSLGNDRWVAIAVTDLEAFRRLALLIGHPEWTERKELFELDGRRRCSHEIDEAINAWSRDRSPEVAAQHLQAAGVCAAPVIHTEDIVADGHFQEAGFFVDLERAFSGSQRQAGFAVLQDGERLGSRTPAPLLGEHSRDVLHDVIGLQEEKFNELVQSDIVAFEPKSIRKSARAV